MLQTLLRPFILITFTVFLILISMLVYTRLAGPIPFSVTSVTTQKTDSFAVTGEGKAKIKPDSATVRLGFNAEGETAKEAQDKMNQGINKVIAAIKNLGIPEKDIKTQNLNVYESPSEVRPLVMTAPVQKPTGSIYRASTDIVVSVSNPALANKVLDSANQEGANEVGGVQFNTEDKSAAENEARQKAVENAKKKAELAAKTAGFSLGKIINYQENSGGFIMPMSNVAMKAETARDSSIPTQLQPGENEISVAVTLSYEVR